MGKQDNNDIAVIKKYANRRLYNTQTSCYITLEDLFEMIQRGDDFIVLDAKTGDDLTRATLTQIIFEKESKGYNLLPISFLKKLVKLYDNKTDNMFSDYLEVAMNNFVDNQEKWRQFSGGSWDEYTPMGVFENVARQNLEMFEKTMGMFNPDDEK